MWLWHRRSSSAVVTPGLVCCARQIEHLGRETACDPHFLDILGCLRHDFSRRLATAWQPPSCLIHEAVARGWGGAESLMLDGRRRKLLPQSHL